MEETISDRFALHLDKNMRQQWHLPIRMGGIGVPKATDVAAPAYLGNVLLALPYLEELFVGEKLSIKDIDGAEEAWKMMMNILEENGGDLPPEAEDALEELGLSVEGEAWKDFCDSIENVPLAVPADQKAQHFLHSLIHIKRLRQWLSEDAKDETEWTAKRDLMRKLAVIRGDKETGYVASWLNVVPCEALGTKVNSPTFLTMLRWWLGASVWQRGVCPMHSANGKACGKMLDKFGDHAVGCRVGPGVISRHDVVNKTWFLLELTAGLSAKMEQRIDGWSRKRPADTLVSDWKGEQWCVQDWTVTHLMTKTLLQAKKMHPDAATRNGEERKNRAEREACEKVGMEFLPLAIDTFGGLGPNAKEALATIAKDLRKMKGDEDEDEWYRTKRMAQKLRLTVLKAVARQILYRSCVGVLEEGTRESLDDKNDWYKECDEDESYDGDDSSSDTEDDDDTKESRGKNSDRLKVVPRFPFSDCTQKLFPRSPEEKFGEKQETSMSVSFDCIELPSQRSSEADSLAQLFDKMSIKHKATQDAKDDQGEGEQDPEAEHVQDAKGDRDAQDEAKGDQDAKADHLLQNAEGDQDTNEGDQEAKGKSSARPLGKARDGQKDDEDDGGKTAKKKDTQQKEPEPPEDKRNNGAKLTFAKAACGGGLNPKWLEEQGLVALDVGQGRGGECQFLSVVAATKPDAWEIVPRGILWDYAAVDRLRQEISLWLEANQDRPICERTSVRDNILSDRKVKAEEEEVAWQKYLRGVRSAHLKQWGDEMTLAASGVMQRPIITLSGERGRKPMVLQYCPPKSWGPMKEASPLLLLHENNYHFTPVKVKENGPWNWTVSWEKADERLVVRQ